MLKNQSSYPSHSFHYKRGPGLSIEITVLEKIHAVNLTFTEKMGLACHIFGEARPAIVDGIREWLKAYVHNQKDYPELDLDFTALPTFTASVLSELRSIPFGQMITYKELAERLDNPKAARAVGGACGRNPFPLFIPCHRVLAAGQQLGGFSQGIHIKERLLSFESIPVH